MKKIVFLLFAVFTLFFFFLPKKVATAVTFFEDNFNDNNISDWTMVRSMQWNNPSQPCLYQGDSALWETKNGMVGIKIAGPPCVTELIPLNISLDTNTAYGFEVDMTMSQDTNMDRNFVFKYQDSKNWYGIHTIGNTIYTHKVVDGTEYFLPNWKVNYYFQDNQVYHFKIEVSSTEIKVFVNGNLVATLPDSLPSFPNSKAGLQASVGAVASSEVWFDNVVVKELEVAPTLDPLILLPGLGASWNTQGMIGGQTDIPPEQWHMTPFVKCYDGLIQSLEDTGYEQGTNFFVYNYDWRKPLDQAADQLKDFIDQNLSPPGTKIDLVGHSLGGLVARTYAQKHGTSKIDQLITLGSPHSGVLQSYLIWEGGQISDRLNWGQVALQLLLEINKTGFQSNVEIVRQLAPSLKDIMPIFNFLKKDSAEIDWQTQNQKNDYLWSLTSNVNQIFDNLLTVFGIGNQTPRWYQVKNANTIEKLLDRWEDGKPIAIEDEDGDQTILTLSAQTPPDPAESLNLNHRDLVQNQAGIEKIFEVLGLPTESISQQPIFNRQNSLVFLLASPAQLKVTDPDNNEFFSDQDGFVIINEPKSGQHQAEIDAINNGGSYHLFLGQLMETEDLWSQFKDEVGPGETDVFKFEIDSEFPLTDPLVDTDGLYYLRLVKSRLTPLNLSSRTMSHLDSAIDLAENQNYSQSKSKVERLISYLFRERKKKTGLQDKEEIYLAILDLTQAYIKLCQAGSVSFNQRRELRTLQLIERLLAIYRRRIEVLDRRGKATSNQAASFEKAEENLELAKAAHPTNLPGTHIYTLVTRLLLYEAR